MSQLLVEKGSVSGVFEFIKHLITHGDTSQRCMVLWLIANITGECKVNAKLVADNIDIATILSGLMNVPTQFSEIVQLVTWNINNLARHGLIRQSDFPKIGTILTYSINNFKDFDAIWAMSKLLNTTEEGLLILCQGKLIEKLLNLLSENTIDFNKNTPLVSCIAHISTSDSDDLMSQLLSNNVMDRLHAVLR